MHFSGVDPIQTSQPAGQATIPATGSKKNFGKAAKQSVAAEPKHKAQLATQAEIVVIAELVLLKVVPTKYLPHPSIGVQSNKVAAVTHVHLSVL